MRRGSFVRLLMLGVALGVVAGLGAGAGSAQPDKKGPKDKDGPPATVGPKEKDQAGPKGKDGPPKDGPKEKAARDLRHAYDTLAEVGAGAKLPPDDAKLYAQAKDIYRAAHKAHPGGGRKAAELAAAANDAGRGLKHLLKAAQPPADLPPPPEGGPGPKGPDGAGGPWAVAHDLLKKTRDRIGDAKPDGGPQARAFLDGSRRAYGLARQAYLDGDYPKAAELARGAEAWTHVGEHLAVADEPSPVPPGDRGPADAPPPPKPGAKGDKAPPPPPPLD